MSYKLQLTTFRRWYEKVIIYPWFVFTYSLTEYSLVTHSLISTIVIQYIPNLQILLSFDVQLHFGSCTEICFFFQLPSSRQLVDAFNITQQKPRHRSVYSPQRKRERERETLSWWWVKQEKSNSWTSRAKYWPISISWPDGISLFQISKTPYTEQAQYVQSKWYEY